MKEESFTDVFGMKKILRKDIQSRISGLSTAQVQSHSSKIQERLLALKQYQDAKNIGIYLSMPTGEASTEGIVRDALSKGKNVFVPYLHKNPGLIQTGPERVHKPTRIMNMVSLHSLQDFETLSRDKWGIPTPDTSTIPYRKRVLADASGEPLCRPLAHEELDIIIMPGVAFDRNCNRLGHGRGFYDFFLSEYQTTRSVKSRKPQDASQPFLVALSLPSQLLPAGQIPVEPHDRMIDMIVTDSETVVRTAGSL